MKTRDLLQLAGDPRFIAGIYNYCDRWCERCAFTSHCLTYAMSEEAEDDTENHDVRNEVFWRQMYAILQQTRELIAGLAKERGLDLESVDYNAIAEDERRRAERAKKHALYRAGEAYALTVNRWFEAHAPEAVNEDVRDALEVVRWYQLQIAVKLRRGLRGREDGAAVSPETGQEDADGSVKVALIGIDRSIIAWKKLLDHLPEKRASILPVLFHLETLRRQTEQEFPQARSFIRPGFDTTPGRFVS